MDTVGLKPDVILRHLGVHSQSVIADFGCGPGVFSLPAAVLTDASVHAIDVRKSMLDVCGHEAQHRSLHNLVFVHANLELDRGSGLPDMSVDFVIMRKILSQNENKQALFREAYRILRASGKLVVIGWSDGSMEGLGSGEHVRRDQAEALGAIVGFEDPEEIFVNVHHYGLAFTRED